MSAPVNEGIICFCHRRTLADLQKAMQVHGSLVKVQEATRAGLSCGGCRAMLHHHFGEMPADINDYSTDVQRGSTVCMKPGNRIMKGFIASSTLLESHVYSCNAVPLQLGDCDAAMEVEFTIYNHEGKPILSRRENIKTGQTFHFDTALSNLPRPFYGMVTYGLGRQNYGASRFNVNWYTKESATSTHENFSTGRPDVVLPVAFDDRFLSGPNTVYLAVQNPHGLDSKVVFRVFRLDDKSIYEDITREVRPAETWKRLIGKKRKTALESSRNLPSMGTMWINTHEELIMPAREALGTNAPLAIRIYSPGATIHEAASMYFFLHHRQTNIWSANHL